VLKVSVYAALLGVFLFVVAARAAAISGVKAPSVHVGDDFHFADAITEEDESLEEFCDETRRTMELPGSESTYGLALANLTLGLVDEDPLYIVIARALFSADSEIAKDPREREVSRFAVDYTDAILSGKYAVADSTRDRMEPIQLKKYGPPTTNFRKIIIGRTAIRVKPNARIKTQVDRVVRDWLQAVNIKDSPWGYSKDTLVQSHEGKKISEILALTNATVVPVWGTRAKKFGESWYAPDADGVYRFEISEDKVNNFPTTIVIDDRTAIINDTHGISAIAWNSLDADLAIGCGDHRGKIEAAYYLAERGVNVYVPTDRFLSMLIGTHTKGLVVGSAPVKKDPEGAVIGDQPISIDVTEPIVVSTTKGHYPLQYYDTPDRYFRALEEYIGKPLKITAVEVKKYGHATNVVEVARKLGAKVLGIRVKSKEEHDAVYSWLKEDKSRRAVLFHTAVYPDGYRLFFEFPKQTSFGDIYPQFEQ
jgi:hypothetical protein